MTDYEAEHNLPAQTTSAPAPPPRRRPDLSTLFSNIRAAEVPTDSTSPSAAHLEPLPVQVTAIFDLLADAWTQMRNDAGSDAENSGLLDRLIGELRHTADDPPRKIEGVSEDFLEGLERVEKRRIKGDEKCPICGEVFLNDPFPLVVVLPCHKDHKFDYECITPWLKLNPTCPLDRKNLVEKKKVPPPVVDEEEDYDDYYA